MNDGAPSAVEPAHRVFARLADPRRLLRSLTRNRELLWQLTRRQAIGRYRGSYLGVIWALLTPLASLAVYTVVFSFIFDARWDDGVADRGLAGFAIVLLTGMVAYNVFGETLVDSPYAIVHNPNYVTKVVFPLEILPVAVVGGAVFHSLIGIAVVSAASLLVLGAVPPTIAYLPVVYLPLIALAAGIGWLMAALGVFLRDVGHMATVAVQLLFFLTPILYPVTALPESVQPWIRLNPLATIVDDFRRVVLWNQPPDWGWYAATLVACLLIMIGGYTVFMALRRAFADVL